MTGRKITSQAWEVPGTGAELNVDIGGVLRIRIISFSQKEYYLQCYTEHLLILH